MGDHHPVWLHGFILPSIDPPTIRPGGSAWVDVVVVENAPHVPPLARWAYVVPPLGQGNARREKVQGSR
jgi:hypothetical protein